MFESSKVNMSKRRNYKINDDTSEDEFRSNPIDRFSQTYEMRRSIRHNSQPKRLGVNAAAPHDDVFSGEETLSDPFADDDSLDEYKPPSPKKMKRYLHKDHYSDIYNNHVHEQMAHQKQLKSHQKNKKSQQKPSTSSSGACSNNYHQDFNSQFEKVSMTKNHGLLNQTAQVKAAMTAGSLKDSTTPVATIVGGLYTADDRDECNKIMNTIDRKLDEVLARMIVLERKIIGGQMSKVELEDDSSVIDNAQRESFVRSNGMPIKNINNLNRFE